MDDLDRRLARHERSAAVAPATLDALASAARREGRASRRWRVTVISASAILALAGGIVAAPAAADVVRRFLAQDTSVEMSGSEVIPDSEWVDLEASDLNEYIESIYPNDTSVPPNTTRDEMLQRTKDYWSGETGVMQEVAIRLTAELLSYCGWTIEMIEAEKAGDERRYDAAVAVLQTAATWPAFVETDGGGTIEAVTNYGNDAANHTAGTAELMWMMGECDGFGFDIGDFQ